MFFDVVFLLFFRLSNSTGLHAIHEAILVATLVDVLLLLPV